MPRSTKREGKTFFARSCLQAREDFSLPTRFSQPIAFGVLNKWLVLVKPTRNKRENVWAIEHALPCTTDYFWMVWLFSVMMSSKHSPANDWYWKIDELFPKLSIRMLKQKYWLVYRNNQEWVRNVMEVIVNISVKRQSTLLLQSGYIM